MTDELAPDELTPDTTHELTPDTTDTTHELAPDTTDTTHELAPDTTDTTHELAPDTTDTTHELAPDTFRVALPAGSAVTITLLRHAQDVHNATGKDKRDDEITQLGRRQASAFAKRNTVHYDVVFASPLQRAIQTALLACPTRPIVLLDGLMERQGALAVCHRQPVAVIQRKYRMPQVDASRLAPGNPPYPAKAETMTRLRARASATMAHIVAELVPPTARNVLVVTHGLWIQALCRLKTPPANCTATPFA